MAQARAGSNPAPATMTLESEILTLRSQGLSIKKISKQLSCSPATVSKYAHRLVNNQEVRAGLVAADNEKKHIKMAAPVDRLRAGTGKSYSAYYNHARGQSFKEALSVIVPECPFCNYNKAKSAIHTHHIDPATKLFGLSGPRLFKWSTDKIINELCKCTVCCSNCHAEIHEGMIDPAEVEANRFRWPNQMLEVWDSILQRLLLTKPPGLLHSRTIARLNG